MLKPRSKRLMPVPAPANSGALSDMFADRRKCRDRRLRDDYVTLPTDGCRRQRWDRRRHRFEGSEWYLRASYVEHEEFW